MLWRSIRLFSVFLVLLFMTGCATGNSFDHMRKDGSILRVERAGATGIMTTGTTRSEFYDCDSAGQNCQLVDTNKTANQSIAGQLATPAAIGYMGNQLGDTGTNVSSNASANGGNSAAMSVSGASASAKAGAVAKGGCQGNCN